jgi:predicted alpha/beta hydrolase family esterase
VVAHSMGAPAIVFMMSTRMHYRIKRLVLVGAPCEFQDVVARFADELSLTPQTVNQMECLTRERQGIPLSAVSLKAMIPYITAPGLVIHDRRDPVIPFEDAEVIAAHWPGSDLVVTEGLGHNKTLRHLWISVLDCK